MKPTSINKTNTLPPLIEAEDPTSKAMTVARSVVTSKTSLVLADISALTIADADDYSTADLLLVRIRQARKLVKDKIEPIKAPARATLDAIQEFFHELDDPLAKGEQAVKGKMVEYKREELRQIEEAKRKAAQEAAKAALSGDQERIIAAKAQVKEVAAVKPVTGAGSRVTVKKMAVVEDMTKFIAGVFAGTIPEICLQVNEQVLATYFEHDRGVVSCWPGVKVEEDVRVGGR